MKNSRLFNKIVTGVVTIVLFQNLAVAAFPFSIKPLNPSAIEAMTDEKLIQVYIDAEIEVEAVGTFFEKAGFTPNDFASYKDLLYFRTFLVMELNKRKMPLPQIK
ncbi:MAG: hypothetical protein AB1650_04740 [Candidatus Omnitrophota bacterium]